MRRTCIAVMAVLVAKLLNINPMFASDDGKEPGQQLQVVDGRMEEPTYQGKTLSYWLKILHNRDENLMSVAFDAVRSMGPRAWQAVPELTRIVAAPFKPIRLGKDSSETTACKLYDIEVRSEAVDALASIGEAASPSTPALIQWALTVRVAPEGIMTNDENERFIELVALDTEYRIRVSDAIFRFGDAATSILVRLLRSSDIETRKFAVVVLGMDALTIATDLLKSSNCDDKALAITILSDMEPFVSTTYISALSRSVVCDAN